MLYIRDHDQAWKPAHKINLNEYLSKNGFVLEFRPHVMDGIEIHGIPRIWRKIDDRVLESQRPPKFKDRFKSHVAQIDSKIGKPISKAYHILR